MGTKSNRVFLELLGDIDRGVYPLHSRLPTENVLCERFCVSRNTVRKAIANLVAENKIEFRKNSGAIVTAPPKEQQHLDTISIMLPTVNGVLNEVQNFVLSKKYTPNFFFQHSHSWEPLFEDKFLDQVLKQRHRALLAFCSPGKEEATCKYLQKLADEDIRVVHMEYYKTSLPDENYLLPDYRRAGRAAATALMLFGYENLYYCGYENMGPVEPLLLEGFLETASDQNRIMGEKRDLFKVEDNANYFQLREYGGCELEQNIGFFLSKLKKNSGVFCGSMARALKLMKILEEHNIRVPEDVGILGIEMMHEYKKEETLVDCVVFDRMHAFQTVIDEVSQYSFKGIKALIVPQIIHNRTMRK